MSQRLFVTSWDRPDSLEPRRKWKHLVSRNYCRLKYILSLMHYFQLNYSYKDSVIKKLFDLYRNNPFPWPPISFFSAFKDKHPWHKSSTYQIQLHRKSTYYLRFSSSEVSRSVITVLWNIWISLYCGHLKFMLTRIEVCCCAEQFGGLNSKRWQNTEFYTNGRLIKKK